MASLFMHAMAFNQPIDHWDVSRVMDMFVLFRGAKVLNQPLD